MRIDRVHLTAYGPFTDHTIDVTAPGVHLVIGPNEAGKSSTLAAIADALFGIPMQTKAGFVHDMRSLEVGLELRRRDGTTLAFRRLKKRKDDLRDAHDGVLDPAVLAGFLGPVERTLFSTMWGIDHDQLVAGGGDLLDGKGEVGEAIFGAVSGVTNLHALMARLESAAEALFKPGGTTPRLNAAIKAFEEAERSARDLALRPASYVEAVREIERLERDLEARQGKHTEALRQRGQCQLLIAVLPNLRKRSDLQMTLDELAPTATRLRDGLTTELDEVTEAIGRCGHEADRLQAEIDEVTEQIDAVAVDAALLAERARINGLRGARDRHVDAVRDLPETRAKAERAKRAAQVLMERLRPGTELAGAPAALALETTAVARVRELAAKAARIELDHTSADKALALTRDDLVAATAQLDARAEPPDHRLLEASITAAVTTAHDAGRLEGLHAQLDQSRAEATRLRTELGLPVDRPGDGPGDGPGVPSVAVVEGFRTELDGLANTTANLTERIEGRRQERTDLATRLERLRSEAEVPSEDDLAARRAVRDERWADIRRRWLRAEPPAGDDDPRPGEAVGDPSVAPSTPDRGGEDAPAADDAGSDPDGDPGRAGARFEAALVEADAVADRLRREADAVAQRAELASQLRRCDEDLLQLDDQLTAHREAVTEAQGRWLELWAPLGVEAGSPADMAHWLAVHAELLGAVVEADRLTAEIERIEGAVDERRRELRHALAGVGVDLDADTGLETLRHRAETACQEAAEANERRRDATKAVEELTRAEARAASELGRAAAAAEAWRTDWSAALERIDLPPTTTAPEAEAFLADAQQLDTELDTMTDAARRVDLMADSVAQFTADVAALAAAVAPDLVDGDPLVVLDAVVTRMDAAVAADNRVQTLTEQRQALVDRRDEAARTLDTARGRLAELVAEAGVDSEADLRGATERSDALRAAEAEMAELDDEISTQGRGRSAAELEGLLGGRDETDLEVDAEEASRQLEQAAAEVTTVTEELAARRAELALLDGSAAAADAAAQAQMARSDIEALTEEYLAVRLAAELLRDQIAAYREAHQAPVLRRAGPWFAQLTCGSFASLETDLDDKGATVLEAVRADGERVGVTGMSEGTRDQLFLALRLAALAESARAQEPYPLVLDDLLMTFDDDRSRAALAILGELAEDVQVLVFAHHEHLRVIAREALGDRVTVHDLEPRTLGAVPAG